MKQVLGIDIGGTKIALVLAQIDGDIRFVDKQAFPTLPVQASLEKIETTADSMLARAAWRAGDLAGIGVSCGGPLDSKKGIIMSPPNLPGWDNIPIVERLEKRYRVPCGIQNDANACALAEWTFGAGRGTRNMVFLTFGTGLGAGLILNGSLYAGTNDNAGEIGHMRLAPFGPVGYGKQGSFEGFASGGGIAQMARIKLMEQFQRGRKVDWCTPDRLRDVSARLVAEQARRGDKIALDVIELSARYLGYGLAYVVDVLNPECIVIGSIYARNVDLFKPAMERALREEALDKALEVCQIRPAQLGEQIGDYAAVSIALNLKPDREL